MSNVLASQAEAVDDDKILKLGGGRGGAEPSIEKNGEDLQSAMNVGSFKQPKGSR